MNKSGRNSADIRQGGRALKALHACFASTIPVMTGYVFLGITYGILMVTNGFPWWLPVMTALIIYTGSMEFLTVSILLSSFNPASAFVTAVMVGARHLFYGLSMLSKYKGMGWKKFYLIYTTSDETFALNYSAKVPEDVDRSWYYLWVSFLDQMYWVFGSLLGAVCGSLITFNTKGLDFVMTSMFAVIFMNQWVQDGLTLRTCLKDHASELIGVFGSIAALVIFGPDHFIIPSMLIILAVLTVGRRKFEKDADERANVKKADE